MSTEEDEKLFKRIIVSQWDLQQAERCVTMMLDILATGKEKESKDCLKALQTAWTVAYSRPFIKNYGSEIMDPILPELFLGDLSEEQRKLHRWILDTRNKDQAHSDGRVADMTIHVTEIQGIKTAIPHLRNSLAPWGRESLEQALEIIQAVIAKTGEEHCRIQETFDATPRRLPLNPQQGRAKP